MESFEIFTLEFYAKWEKNKFSTRFPGGESYGDVVARLEPLLIEMEQQTCPVVVVSHRTVLQVLRAYFHGSDIRNWCDVDIPHGKIMVMRPTRGGAWKECVINLNSSPKHKSPFKNRFDE